MQFRSLSTLPPLGSRLTLVLVGLLALTCVWIVFHPARFGPASPSHDVDLYRAILARVRAGQDYASAAIIEHRRLHYPLRPFFVVRPPALTLMLAALPPGLIPKLLYIAIAALGFGAWVIRLRFEGASRLIQVCLLTGLGLGMGAAVLGIENSLWFHETWIGFLFAGALGVRRVGRVWPAVLAGLLAALLRELATPFLLAMGLAALLERRWGEVAAFATAIGLVGVEIVWHAQVIRSLTNGADLHSQGWLTVGGLGFLLETTTWNLAPTLFGGWISALILPLSLIGLILWDGPTGLRLKLVLGGYCTAFLLVGRPDNVYWGLMIAPLIGLTAGAGVWGLIDLLAPRPSSKS
ncbi:MAG: hypothetical protein CGW95_10220 [Phenylobacterium zucineum]|nr:MAG: hypothetical protein CGW95_10220 [Phenylobacterium zucineum]